jgi:two-component system, NtrC family, response regulator AtoC
MYAGRPIPIRLREIPLQPASRLSAELGESFLFPAASPAMARVRSYIERVASVNVPVLLLGESGVGKKVVARWIHRMSVRAHRTFFEVNCAALPSELLESELFGYEAGAFARDLPSKAGLFELGNEGTILLDEIGEMSPASQPKLLRVLEDGQFFRLGGHKLIETDVRILAATKIDVRQALAKKTLREDLYYRLSCISIRLPPLRERREEIPLFLLYFMERLAAQLGQPARPYSREVLEACNRYAWPGNVRELENFVKRYLILRDESFPNVDSEMSGDEGVPLSAGSANGLPVLKSLLYGRRVEIEKEAIFEALQRSGWRRKEAARRLRIGRKSFCNSLQIGGMGITKKHHDFVVDLQPSRRDLPSV